MFELRPKIEKMGGAFKPHPPRKLFFCKIIEKMKNLIGNYTIC